MPVADVAKKLTDLCRKGEFAKATDELYAKDIISVEPHAMNNMPREAKGLDAVKKKGEWWENNHTVHGCKVTGPFTSQDKFSVVFEIDATEKPTGKRSTMQEIAVYTVKNDKIVHEEFLYLG